VEHGKMTNYVIVVVYVINNSDGMRRCDGQ